MDSAANGGRAARAREPAHRDDDATEAEITKPSASPAPKAPSAAPARAAETLSITDNRTGKSYEVPIVDGTIRSMDLRQIKTGPEDFGIMAYDPAFTNTAACRSAITEIDGDKGILNYRGYPIEQLAEE